MKIPSCEHGIGNSIINLCPVTLILFTVLFAFLLCHLSFIVIIEIYYGFILKHVTIPLPYEKAGNNER